MQKVIKKIIALLRIIIGIFIIFIGLIGMLTNLKDIASIIIGIIFILIGCFIYPDLKGKILSITNSGKKINVKKEIVSSYNSIKNNINVKNEEKIKSNFEIYVDDIEVSYDFNDYQSFKSGNKKFKPFENDVYVKWSDFWEGILKAYSSITIKQEGVKQNGNLEEMKNFENDIHIFFKERVLIEAKNQGLIDNIDPEQWKSVNEYYEYNYSQFLGRELNITEYEEAMKIFNFNQEVSKNNIKKQIYDLYCKSLRRVGNYYKSYKQWELALNTFIKIKEFGFEGIMDGKSIIKCQKEINLKNQKLIKN